MESKNKFWKGVLVGVLVTAFAGLIVVGGAAGIFLIGRSVMENQAQVQSLAEGTEDGEVSAVDWNQVEMKSKRIQAIIESYFLFDKDNQRNIFIRVLWQDLTILIRFIIQVKSLKN